jgi:hypothetical protein
MSVIRREFRINSAGALGSSLTRSLRAREASSADDNQFGIALIADMLCIR